MVWHFKKWIQPLLLALVGIGAFGWLYCTYALEHKEAPVNYVQPVKDMVQSIFDQCHHEKVSGTYKDIREIKGEKNDPLAKVVLPTLFEDLNSKNNDVLRVMVPPDEYAGKIKQLREQLMAEKV